MRILPVYLLISCRFGPWKRTIPFTVKWLTDIVGVWLGIQTRKKWTVKRSTKPGNCPAISFWLGEFNFKLTWKWKFFTFYLFSGLDNGTILIWTPLEEKQVKYLSQHQADVHYLSYSPDGVFLASADCDRKLVIWSTKVTDIFFQVFSSEILMIGLTLILYRRGNPFSSVKMNIYFQTFHRGCLPLTLITN